MGRYDGNQDLIENKISTLNVRAASVLSASSTYQGTGEDVSKYGRAGVSITSSNASDGVLTIEVSHDNVNWGGPARTISDARFSQPHMWEIVEKYFRIKYVNGTTEANDLSIQVQYSNNGAIFLGHQLDETLINETEAIVVRAVSVGSDPNNAYKNFDIAGVDNNNSSATNLTIGTSLMFTGEWSIIENYGGISVLVDGTSIGNVGGKLQMQFSHNGVTVHRNITVKNSDVGNVSPRTLGVVAKYFRVLYTADSDLLSFDIQTMLHNVQVALVSRLDQDLSGTDDVSNVRSVLAGRAPDGHYHNVRVDENGQMTVVSEGVEKILKEIVKGQNLTNDYLESITGGIIR